MIRQQLAHFFVVSLILTTALCQDIGEACTVRQNRAQGTCKLVTDCPKAEQQYLVGYPTPTLCDFQSQFLPIVCCENDQDTGNSELQPNENSFLDVDSLVFPDSIDPEPTAQVHSSKSEEKCIEYNKLVASVVNAVPLITDPEKVSINIAKCDNDRVPLIVGGTPAEAGEYPFMAAVGYNDENQIGWFCGGTLISEYYVVTAAHCATTKFYGPPVKVRLGDLDLKNDNDNSEHVDYDVVEIKIHEQYRPPSRYNDIALLKLSPKVEFTVYIRPACLWTKSFFEQTRTIATGWGKTGVAEDQSDKLLKVELNILDNAVCRKSYPPNNRNLPRGIQPTMMCAGDLKGGKDTCQGDSGGPLTIVKKENQCRFYIVGITSFGKGCGGPNLPAVYTRISSYIPWMENIIW